MTRLNDDQLRALSAEFSATLARYAPEWGDKQAADPGITLVELFAFVTESLTFRQDSIPARDQASLNRLVDRLISLCRHACTCLNGLQRPRYFDGQLLTPADFQAEQDYFRQKMRRRNCCGGGAGIISGLAVTLDPASITNKDPVIIVEPGCAIAPDGEQLIVCALLRCTLRTDVSAGYVTLCYFERPVGSQLAIGEASQQSRIEEGVAVDFKSGEAGEAVRLARLERAAGTWRLDPQFHPARLE